MPQSAPLTCLAASTSTSIRSSRVARAEGAASPQLLPCQPAVQRHGLGRRAAARQEAPAPRRPRAEGHGEFPLRAAHGPPHCGEGPRSACAGRPIDFVKPAWLARDPEDLIEAGLVACMVVPPGMLLHSAWIPACPRTLAIGSKRRAEMRFIDARRLGRIVDRTHRGLAYEVATIADSRHAWRTGSQMLPDLAGAPRWTVRKHGMCRLRGAVSVRHPSRTRGNCLTRR